MISPDQLKSIFHDNNLRMLPNDRMQYLLSAVRMIATKLPAAPAKRQFLNDGAARKAVEVIKDTIKLLKESGLDGEEKERLEQLSLALFMTREFFQPVLMPRAGRVAWHALAVEFADAYMFASGQVVAPRRGLSKGGPVSRFVRAALSHMPADSHPTLDAVSQALVREYRERDKSLRGSVPGQNTEPD